MGSNLLSSVPSRWVGEGRKPWPGPKLDGPFGRRVCPDPGPGGAPALPARL